jgi:V8-like Glu-specific endopeptidase
MSFDQDLVSGGSGSVTTSVTQRRRDANGLDGDLISGSAGSTATATARSRGAANGLGANEFAVGEVIGDESTGAPTETAIEAANTEVSSAETTESGEEYIEASPAELAAAESGEETAVSDLRGIEGFEASEAAQEGDARVQAPLREVGEAVEGGQEEFFPILAALIPTLVSTIGPAVAKGVMGKLSPRATRAIQRQVPRVAGAAIKSVQGTGGTSNLLALIAKLLATAQAKPGGESGMEVDEAFVENAVAAIEVIIGNDDRVRITQTMDVPWRRICALRITFPSGTIFRGTGFFISKRAVVTAGHCVYLHNQGGWARKVEVIPGCNGSSRPFGQVVSTSFRSVSGWVTDKKPEHDYGCILLPAGSFDGRNLGNFGFAVFDAPKLLAQPAVVAGYPGDKPFAEMWGMARLIKAVTAKTLVYDIDTMGGQSGAPVYIKRNGVRYVVGIHNYGAVTGNSATRVTKPVGERLLAWSKL